MKLLYITLLLVLLQASNVDADSHNHAKHKAHAKSAHKAKHHHKKDADDIDLM